MQEIIIPKNKEQLEYLLQTTDDWGIALAHYMVQIKYQHHILKFVEETETIFPSEIALEPIPIPSRYLQMGHSMELQQFI